MENYRRRAWSNRVTADASLRESASRVTARNPHLWGYFLARLRVARRQTLAEQARALGLSESALTFLSICRLPRPGHREVDLTTIVALLEVRVEFLRGLLAENLESDVLGGVG